MNATQSKIQAEVAALSPEERARFDEALAAGACADDALDAVEMSR